jgi:5-methylcytosine-specific restriction endonuclease McrA
MIEPKQVRVRASKLFYDITRRSEPKLWKSGRMKGRVRWPGMPVPYTSDEFATWLLTEIGCSAFLCPYCNAPLDVLSMTLDHDFPLKCGGSNEFRNLVPCCRDCNELKGKMTGKEYMLFRDLMRKMSPAAEGDVLQRLRFGLNGMRASQRSHAEKHAKQKSPTVQAIEEAF